MFIEADSLDDLLRRVIAKALKKGHRVEASRGSNTELFGVLLQLNKPRARLSRTERRRALFSCLGEFLWYLSKKNELPFIAYYVDRYEQESEDGETIRTGYGPRLFRNIGADGTERDQIENVISTLKEKAGSRRAVAQIFEAADSDPANKEAPCTCTMQFAIRAQKLHMMTFMRSNDIYLGLPHDVFAFTMLQEALARTLGVGLGKYHHAVGSLHLYDKHLEGARKMMKEGWQESIPMPPMPEGDPWPSLKKLLYIEAQLRVGEAVDLGPLSLEPYWQDLARLLQIYRLFRNTDTEDSAKLKEFTEDIGKLKKLMTVKTYDPFIEHKRKNPAKRRTPPSPRQGSLDFKAVLSRGPAQ